MTDIDKRRAQRKELRIEASLKIDGRSPMSVRTTDVGRYGMCLIGITQKLTTGKEVDVAFEMFFAGKIHTVAVSAKVSHCIATVHDGYKAGLQFINLDSAGVSLLSQYVGS